MTPRDVNEKLRQAVESLAQTLYPAGKRVGHEWCVGSVSGEHGQSCKINISDGSSRGAWSDFEKGQTGDLIELVKLAKGMDFKAAFQWSKDFLGVRNDSTYFTVRKPKPLNKVFPPTTTPSVLKWLTDRKLSADALAKYKVTSQGETIVFPYYHGKDLLFVKYRDISKPKKESMRVEAGGDAVLFGWQAISDDTREVVITEGELDALAYATQGYPALSVPFGGGAGEKQKWIQNEYDNLERFDTLYISMDMDAAGKEGCDEIVKRLGRHRCKIVSLPQKDANDCLMAGLSLSKAIGDAQYSDPEELKCATHFLPDVHKIFEGVDESLGDYLPWRKADKQFRMRDSEVTLWHGINGHGKSMILSHIAANLICDAVPVCIASMEMPPKQLLKRMFQQIAGIELPSFDLRCKINQEAMQYCFLVNIHGTAKTTMLMELFAYAVLRFGCRHLVVDSLAKCGMAEDDYNAQKFFIDKLSDFAHEYSVHVHLVCHDRKGDDELRSPGKMDIKGTGAISDLVDNVVSIWRNKPKEDKVEQALKANIPVASEIIEKPDCLLCVQKQRNYDWEGKIGLWFDKASHQYLEKSGFRAEMLLRKDTHEKESDSV